MKEINSLIEKSKELLIKQSSSGESYREDNSSIIFTGNIHDSFPRRLITEPYLTARDKLAWQLIRLHSQQNNKGAVFPSYDELQSMLATFQCNGAKASRSTVSHTLIKLRLTRWISLCQTVRNENTGTVIGNIYFLHDEPLSIIDAIRFDLTYLDLLLENIHHSNNQVKFVAEQVTLFIVKNKNFNHLISFMPLYEERLKDLEQIQVELNENLQSSKNGLSKKQLSSKKRLRENLQNPKMRLSKKTPSSKSVPCIKSDSYSSSTSTSTSIYKNTSTSILLEQINWPIEFSGLDDLDRNKIISIANSLSIDITLFNAVVQEVSERTKRQTIKSITAYTINTLKKAANGLFNQQYAVGAKDNYVLENTRSITESNESDISKSDLDVVTQEKVIQKFNEIRALAQIKVSGVLTGN